MLASLEAAGGDGADFMRRQPETWRFLQDHGEGSLVKHTSSAWLEGRYQ